MLYVYNSRSTEHCSCTHPYSWYDDLFFLPSFLKFFFTKRGKAGPNFAFIFRLLNYIAQSAIIQAVVCTVFHNEVFLNMSTSMPCT